METSESVEARLAPEMLRAGIIGATGILVCCIVAKRVSVYIASQDGQANGVLVSLILLLASLMAVLLFLLVLTWRMRILSTGVELRFLLFRIVWRWADFRHAEAGHYQVYFPLLPLWKRYLDCSNLEPAAGGKIWRKILEHVPPPEKWTRPLEIKAEPSLKITFLDEGVTIRRFRKWVFSWDDLKKAVIFQSAHSERGFTRLHLLFDKRTYFISQAPSLRKQNRSAADYDVVEFLKKHVPKEKLVFCSHSGPASSIEECVERRKVLAKEKRIAVLTTLSSVAAFLYLSYGILYGLFDEFQPISAYWVIWIVASAVVLILLLSSLIPPLWMWRNIRNEEKELDQGRDRFVTDEKK